MYRFGAQDADIPISGGRIVKDSNIARPGKPALTHPIKQRGQELHALYDEAAKKLEPIFADTAEQSFSTLMYLAMHTLHGAYPQLSHDELEALFMGLVKHQRARSTAH